MTLIGVPPMDREAARANFERLGSVEIDQRLDRLRTGSAKVNAWRARRGAPDGDKAIGSGTPISVSPRQTPAQSTLGALLRIDRSLAEWLAVMNRMGAAEPRRMEMLRELGERHRRLSHPFIAFPAAKGTGAYEEFLSVRLDNIAALDDVAAAMARREVESLLRHPILPSSRNRLTAGDTLEALGRVANSMAKRPPNLIVAINEGLAVARILNRQLNLRVPITRVRGSADEGLEWSDASPAAIEPRLIWVVGHVARTGATLVKTIQQARTRFATSEVFGAVLAASTDALDHFQQFHFHQLAEASTIELAFDPTKGVKFRGDKIVLEDERADSPDVFVLSRSLIGRAQLDMAREFHED